MSRAAPAILGLVLLAATAAAEGGAGHMDHMGAHMHEGPHMRFTELRPLGPGDRERATRLLADLRAAISRYRDHEVALAGGFQPFLPTVPQDVYHFVHYPATADEYRGLFDVARPGSLLYRRRGGDWQLVGAMYSAPAHFTPDRLHERIPLGVARWHAHVNVCLPEGITLEDLTRGEIGAGNPHLAGTIDPSAGALAGAANRRFGFMADGRFGFEGRIADPSECRAAGGHFIPQAWGWMTHVYPFAGDDLEVAYGLDVPD